MLALFGDGELIAHKEGWHNVGNIHWQVLMDSMAAAVVCAVKRVHLKLPWNTAQDVSSGYNHIQFVIVFHTNSVWTGSNREHCYSYRDNNNNKNNNLK